MAENNPKDENRDNGNIQAHCLTKEEIEVFREDYREKDREIQRNIGIYLSGLVLITGWLIGPQTKPLIKMALDNDGYNLFGFLVVVALNVIFTCFLIYKSLIIHEIMQFVVVHSEKESGLNYWEAWRRSSQSATNRGLVRGIYNGLVLTALPLFVSLGILIPLGYLIHCESPQKLAEKLKQFESAPAVVTINAPPSISPAANPVQNELQNTNTQTLSNTSNAQPTPIMQNTTATAGQLEFVFYLVKYFFWLVVALHFFPLWFFYQNIGPINKRWGIINSRQISPSIYNKLETVYVCEELPIEPDNNIKSDKVENEPENKKLT